MIIIYHIDRSYTEIFRPGEFPLLDDYYICECECFFRSLEKKIKSQELKIQQLDDGQRGLQSDCVMNVTESTAF